MKKNRICSDKATPLKSECGPPINTYDSVFIDLNTMKAYDKDKNLIGIAEFKNGIYVINQLNK